MLKIFQKNPETTVSKGQVALATLVEVINDKRYFDQSNQLRKTDRTPNKVKESDVQRVTTQYREQRNSILARNGEGYTSLYYQTMILF